MLVSAVYDHEINEITETDSNEYQILVADMQPKLSHVNVSTPILDIPHVAVCAAAQVAAARVEGAWLAGRAPRQLARSSAAEEESCWSRVIRTVFDGTLVFGQGVPRGVLLTKACIRAGGVGAAVFDTTIEDVVIPRLAHIKPCTHQRR